MFQKAIVQLTNIWQKFDGLKLWIGLALYFITDHVLPTDNPRWHPYNDLLQLVAYAFVMVGGGHKFIKSKYGQQIKTRLLA
jgi:hypothetical protein